MSEDRKPWPHQERANTELDALIPKAEGPIALACPTGGGKTWIMCERLLRLHKAGKRGILYTDRRMLLEQIGRELRTWSIPFGVRAAGHRPALWCPIQLSSIQTERSRVFDKAEDDEDRWELHQADEVFLDEAHKHTAETAERVIRAHIEQGAAVIGPTATPIGMGGIYKHIVEVASNSELRKCGAHVVCNTFAPDEPDLRKIKPTATGEYTEGDVSHVMMTPTIFARVLESWKKLNPDGKPTILFAPGVAESIFFAKEFEQIGVRAAHIDGDHVYVDGKSRPSDQDVRDEIMAGSKDGSIPVICNRFVLREGIDAPWLAHCIMATVFGGLTGYLQSGGRLIRAFPGLDSVTLQDHGGNYWRHGSLNADRSWRLDCTDKTLAAERAERIIQKKEPEPIVCFKCGAVRKMGAQCTKCGYEMDQKVRRVVQLDGSLRLMKGDVYKPRKTSMKSDTQKAWDKVYWRFKKAGKTFAQAYGYFAHVNKYWPPKTLDNMPKLETTKAWSRRINDTDRSEIRYTPQQRQEQPPAEKTLFDQ